MKNCPVFFLAAVLLLSLLSGCQQEEPPAETTPAQQQAAQDLLTASGQPADETYRVAQDLRLLSPTVFGQMVRVEAITPEGITYAIDYSDTTEFLQVAAQEDGGTAVTITDGARTDVFTYRTGGKFLLNGQIISDCEPLAQGETGEKDGLLYQAEAAPAALLAQTHPHSGVEDLVPSQAYTFVDTPAQIRTLTLPVPAEDLTLSAMLNILGTHAAGQLQKAMVNPTAAGLPVAVSQALAENRETAAAVLRGKGVEDSQDLSYMLHRYAAADQDTAAPSHLYVISTFTNSYWYGENFLWGVLETGQTM